MVDYILKTAMERRRIVTIIYQKGDTITKRSIKVLEYNGETVKAFCLLRNQIRIFNKDNILSAVFYRGEKDKNSAKTVSSAC